MMSSVFYIAFLVVVLIFLFHKKVLANETWRATMTPLASIIGSGFLIAAPLLNNLGGDYAPWLMLGLCLIAYGIGEVLRWNIQTVEVQLEKGSISTDEAIFEKLSDWSLAFAYILSITYYLYIFSSFMLKGTGTSGVEIERIVATSVLCIVAFYGHQNGLNSIEKIEGITVNVKLGIIATFILSLIVFNFNHSAASASTSKTLENINIPMVLGLLIMVQGFETSRYLGEKYDGSRRVRSMRFSQIISTAVYMLFLIFFVKVFELFPIEGEVNETSVIDISKNVLNLGPLLLLVAALASQLSAAVADMGGAGGLFQELSKNKIKANNAYLIIAGLGITLIWCFNIFEVISYASKAFAFYYFMQCLSSFSYQIKKNKLKAAFSILMAIICLAVIFFGKAFE